MAKKIDIAGQLNSAAADNKLADASQIYDSKKGKFQEKFNEEIEAKVESYKQELEQDVNNAVANLIGGASETFDTLKEFEDWINNDTSGAAAITKQTNENKTDISDLNVNTGISEYPTFDTAVDYAVGDVVVYEGRLKRFIADHAQGEWIGTDVEKWSERKEREEEKEKQKIASSRYPAYNILDPNKVEFFKYIANNGRISKSEYLGFFIIKILAEERGIINPYSTIGSTFKYGYIVEKTDNSSRFVEGHVYTYEEGDKYVTIGFRVRSLDSLNEYEAREYIRNNIGAYIGEDEPSSFVPYDMTESAYIYQTKTIELEGKTTELKEKTSELEERTNNIVEFPAYNILDPNKAEFYKYITKDAKIATTQALGYFITKVKAKREGLITEFASPDFPAFLVEKEDGSIRVINRTAGSSVYTYEEGDKYVTIQSRVRSLDTLTEIEARDYIRNNIGIYIGSELPSSFVPYDMTKGNKKANDEIKADILSINEKIDGIEAVKLSEIEKIEKNSKKLWMNKTVIYYRKPNVNIDNIVNFDNLMAACNYAVRNAAIDNQFEIQVWEDITSAKESDFTEISDYPNLHALFRVKEYIKLRGMGTMKTIHGELLPINVTNERVNYETGHFDGGELENLRITAKNIRYPIHFERAGGVIAQNKEGYIRYCDIIHYGGEEGAEGTETSAYKAWDAWGMGSSQGTKLIFEGCNIIGARHGFRCHTNGVFEYPTKIDFKNCTIIGFGGNAFNLDEYGCKCVTEYIIQGCNIQGNIAFSNTANTRQTIPYGMKIAGNGNTSCRYVRNELRGLRLIADEGNANCKIVSDDAGLFGDTITRKGEHGLEGYVCGLNNVGGATSLQLPSRLGDCSTSNKSIIVEIGNVIYTVVFNKNYSLMTNSEILAEMNAYISDAAFDLYDPNTEYYPEFTDVLFHKKNNGLSVIRKGDFVKFDGIFGVIKCEESEASAICVADCGIGDIGRFRVNIKD